MEAVHLRPRDGGILMPEGRDVFIQACTYMPKNVLHLLEKNGYTLDNLTYFIGHQANAYHGEYRQAIELAGREIFTQYRGAGKYGFRKLGLGICPER